MNEKQSKMDPEPNPVPKSTATAEDALPRVTSRPTKSKASDVAADLLRGAVLEQAAVAVKQMQEEEEYVYSMACDLHHTPNDRHAGIWFTINPEGREINGGQWYSVYRENDGPFHGTLSEILCQQCLLSSGEKRPLMLWPVRSGSTAEGLKFRIPPRKARTLVWRVKRSKIEEFAKRGAELLEKGSAAK